MSEELKVSAEMHPISGWDDAFAEIAEGKIGGFFFSRTTDGDREYESLVVVMPDHGPTGAELASLPLKPGEPREGRACWEWDGNREAPTLSPSVHRPGTWHGFIRAGRLESC